MRLSGRLDCLRELPLGVDVFERGSDFDPRLDPIVRIDARRLRARLTEYYEGPGAFDDVDIVLSRGGYVPEFRRRHHIRPQRGGSAKRSVAVLPFEGWNPGGDGGHYGKVLTEELVSILGQMPGWYVRVCPANSVLPGQDAPDVLIRGGITRMRDSVRLAVNLVRGADGSLLSSKRFECNEAHACDLHHELSEYVLAQLGEPGAGDGNVQLRYLQGRYLMNHNTPDALRKAVACFEKVVARDPHCSRAWSGMAASIATMIFLESANATEILPKAALAAAKALESEPHLPEVRTAAAMMMALVDGEFVLARRTLDSVIKANPHFVAARVARATHCLLPEGNYGEARTELETALAADPANPSALYAMSLVHSANGLFDEARETLEAVLRISAEYPACWRQLSEVHRQLGNGQDALAAYQRYEELAPAPNAASSAGLKRSPTNEAARALDNTAVFS